MDSRSVGNNPIDPVGPPHLQTVDDPHGAHEEVDVNPRPLFIFLVVLAAVIVGVMLLMILLFHMLEDQFAKTDPAMSPLAAQRQQFQGVLLEDESTKEIDALRKQQAAIMTEYKWIDEQERIVRVPVDVAMEAVAKHGLPRWSAVPVAAAGNDQPSQSARPEAESGAPGATSEPISPEGEAN